MTERSRTNPASSTTQHLAYAEASLMLVESLMLALLEKKLLTVDELRSLIETAVETKQAFVDARVHPEISNVAAGVLRRLANSISAARSVRRVD